MRHPALLPLTHDHHHALVWARRLRLAADGTQAARRETAEGFLEYFEAHAIPHFREEEELLFPLMAERLGTVPDDVSQLLVQHLQIHTLVLGLRRAVGDDLVEPEAVATLGRRFEIHIRLEENKVFPHIEEALGEDLAGLHLAPRGRAEGGLPPVG